MSLVVKNLTKRFTIRGTPAVSEVSFDAPTGAVTALLGPSGSGKSTVLRIIAGLETPDQGQVFINNEDQTHVPVAKRNLGFVFQSYALFKHMTVRRNIAFGLGLRKMPAEEANNKVDALLRTVQLEGYAERYPSQLSGGQRQRVAFARALAIEPKILLLDEPFGALDTSVRVELRDWLRRFHEEHHVTTMIVTHDQEEAMELAEHIVVMHEGRVAQAGSPRQVYDHPATPFVASFVGGANVLPGTVEGGRVSLTGTSSVAHNVTLAHSHAHHPDGTAVNAYVRPHDIKLTKAGEESPDVSVARVERLVWLGGYVKVSVRLPDGAPMTVEMPKTEIELLKIAEGDLVMADLRNAKVFIEDYTI